MKKYIFILIFIKLNQNVYSQDFFARPLFTNEIFSNTNNKKITRGLENIAEQLLQIGEYKRAIQIKDLSGYLQGIDDNNLTNFPKINYKYQLLPAKNYIINKSKNERIIIINEAHHQPLHRVFTSTLLKELFLQGYKYLALETLAEDSLLNYNKYPIKTTGYYSSEPQYGNLIREALSIGYILVAYEHNGKGGWDKREYEQANNIKKKTFDKDANAKVLIHCGYGHGMEYTDGSDTLMGAWLKVLTGINPLTINQTTLTEHSSVEYENIFYRKLSSKVASAFMHNKNLYELYRKEIPLQEYDIDIYHPRSQYKFDRPIWLNMSGEKKTYFPNDNKNILLEYPIIIQAFYPKEDLSIAIPTDCIELLNKDVKKAMILKPGKYILKIVNKTNKEQLLEIEIE